MGIEKADRVAAYYAIKLNVPWRHADTIRALVPEGQPMSKTLIGLLLDLASERGIETTDREVSPDETARLHERIDRLSAQVSDLRERLDAVLALRRQA